MLVFIYKSTGQHDP